MNQTFDDKRFKLPKFLKTTLAAIPLSLLALHALEVRADELPRWDTAITKYNEKQVRNFHPVFDFDSDGCYPATPFDRNANLRQNPGRNATASLSGNCQYSHWGVYANTIHRQLCKATDEGGNKVERCAHFYELYFEKDQAVGLTFLGGHRHDVETVIVWTGKINGQGDFISHTSVSAHGKFTTKRLNEILNQSGHPMVVYHKDGAGTHAFRFANAQDKAHVEFLGNWGEFYAPDIISHYSALPSWDNDEWTRYQANRNYRLTLEGSNFGSASFKTRNDGEILNNANSAIPRNDPFWQNFSFSYDDVWATRAQEFQANYPQNYQQIRE